MSYKLALEGVKQTLESHYTAALFGGDLITAYDILGEMMAYKVLDPKDERLTNDYIKKFKSIGVTNKDRFHLDYRKDSNYLGKWIYGTLPKTFRTQFTSEEHWGKRVEGAYEGDVKFEARAIDIVVTPCSTPIKALRAMESIKETSKELGGKVPPDQYLDRAKSGEYRLYTVSVAPEHIIQYRELGSLFVAKTPDGIVIAALLNHTVLNKCFFDIRKAYIQLLNSFKNEFPDISEFGESIKTTYLADVKSAYNNQVIEWRNRKCIEKSLEALREESLAAN